MRWFLGLVVTVAVIWIAWIPLRAFLFGGRMSYANTPVGEWVGQMNITGGYSPKTMGDTPGPHQHAVIRFKLSVEDRFMDEYGGPGELYIQGEAQPRVIRISHFRLNKNGQVSTYMLSQPVLVERFNAHFSPQEITFSQPDPWDLQFNAALHRGTDADYDALRKQLESIPPK